MCLLPGNHDVGIFGAQVEWAPDRPEQVRFRSRYCWSFSPPFCCLFPLVSSFLLSFWLAFLLSFCTLFPLGVQRVIPPNVTLLQAEGGETAKILLPTGETVGVFGKPVYNHTPVRACYARCSFPRLFGSRSAHFGSSFARSPLYFMLAVCSLWAVCGVLRSVFDVAQISLTFGALCGLDLPPAGRSPGTTSQIGFLHRARAWFGAG